MAKKPKPRRDIDITECEPGQTLYEPAIDYHLRDIPVSLHEEFKVYCVRNQRSIRNMLLSLMAELIRSEDKPPPCVTHHKYKPLKND